MESIIVTNLSNKPEIGEFESWLRKHFTPSHDYKCEVCPETPIFGNMAMNEKLYLALQEEFNIL